MGLGIGALIFGGGSDPDPSAEVSEILGGKKSSKEKELPEENENAEEESEVELECVENADGEEECVPKKKVKKVNVEEKFLTTYYEFQELTTNLETPQKISANNSRSFNQYDEEVMINVESHQLALMRNYFRSYE